MTGSLAPTRLMCLAHLHDNLFDNHILRHCLYELALFFGLGRCSASPIVPTSTSLSIFCPIPAPLRLSASMSSFAAFWGAILVPNMRTGLVYLR